MIVKSDKNNNLNLFITGLQYKDIIDETKYDITLFNYIIQDIKQLYVSYYNDYYINHVSHDFNKHQFEDNIKTINSTFISSIDDKNKINNVITEHIT